MAFPVPEDNFIVSPGGRKGKRERKNVEFKMMNDEMAVCGFT
jgi:hypothetical protein